MVLFYVVIYALSFYFGASIGSFIGATSSRMDPNNKNKKLKEVFLTRSHCDSCMKQLNPLELFPVIAYISQKGKCKGCEAKIGMDYFILESICGLIALIAMIMYIGFGSIGFLELSIYLLVSYLFIYLAFYDYLYWEVPIKLIIFSYILAFVILLIALLMDSINKDIFVNHLVASGIGLLSITIIIYITKFALKLMNRPEEQGLGWGDVWIFGLVGLILGFNGLIEVFFISIFAGAVVGIIKILLQKKEMKGEMVQFVPFIALGVIISVFTNGLVFGLLFPTI